MSKDKILSDHIKKGKKYITRLNHDFDIQETDWIDQVIPELLWLHEVNSVFDLKESAQVVLTFVNILKEYLPVDTCLSLCSSYDKLSKNDYEKVLKRLEIEQILHKMQYALHDFNILYPKNPLYFLAPDDTNASLLGFKERLSKLYYRDSHETVFMTANAVYIEFITGKLQTTENTSLSKFPEIEDYPNTEISKQIAISTRQAIRILVSYSGNSTHQKRFWERGLELEKCY